MLAALARAASRITIRLMTSWADSLERFSNGRGVWNPVKIRSMRR